LECDEAMLLPHDRRFRNDVIRYLREEIDFVTVFDWLFRKENGPPDPTNNVPSSTTPTQYLRLAGAWEGCLRWKANSSVNVKVFLVIANCSTAAWKGILYYEGFDTNENKLVFRGADILLEDAHNRIVHPQNTCKLEFERRTHDPIEYKSKNMGDKREDKVQTMKKTMKNYKEHPPRYQWNCQIKNPRARTYMRVEMIRLPDPGTDVWTGDVFRR
jgi:hypothetical protein